VRITWRKFDAVAARTAVSLVMLLVAIACSGKEAGTNPGAATGPSIPDTPCAIGPIMGAVIPEATPGLSPPVVDAGSFDTKWPIKHVVFIMKENRSFDQFFGAFPGANGTATAMVDGKQVDLMDCIPQKLIRDIVHSYPVALESYNRGAMDGFATSPFAREYAYSRAAPSDIPNYWRWASDFTLSDNFFASALGPSYPNHLFTFAAQSAGTHDNPVQETLLPGYLHRQTNGLAKS